MAEATAPAPVNLNRRRLALLLLPFLLSFLLLAAAVWHVFIRAPEIPVLRIAAGEAGSESLEVITAIAEVAEKSTPPLKIEVMQTSGSAENVTRVIAGSADLGAVQADAILPDGPTLVAALYPEYFQLLARPAAGIRDFGDLPGKRVALPEQSSGGYRSFWLLANHYGLPAEQLRVTTLSGVALIDALRQGTVDAVFRVRPSRNRELRSIVQNTDAAFVPVAQGKAIHLRYATIDAAILPEGAYRGSPPLPAGDLPTVAIDRLLIARARTDAAAVRQLTAILFEKRRDLAQRAPLAGVARAPDILAGTLLPLHPGAAAYFDRDKPSFFEQNSDLLGLGISLAAVLTSILLWLKRRLDEGRKGRIDVYNLDLARLNAAVAQAPSTVALDQQRSELYAMLGRVVHDLDEDRVAGEGFHTFAFTWSAVQKAIDDRLKVLERQ